MVMRFKALLPNGIDSVSPDSLRKLTYKIGLEYANTNPEEVKVVGQKKVAWSPEIEKAMREIMLNDAKKEGRELDVKFCDCVIAKLKKMYPDSLQIDITNEVKVKMWQDCSSEVKSGIKQNR